MKSSRGLILVGALAMGSAALVGCKGADVAADAAGAATEECASSDESADEDTVSDNAGVEAYARGGHGRWRGGRGHGRGWGHARGFRGHRGLGHAGRWWHFW